MCCMTAALNKTRPAATDSRGSAGFLVASAFLDLAAPQFAVG